ncbi:MAG: enoyl-CoA hydratase/isomerase family protein [Novosphingobium sp.]|nr:enoyl-CoA hydratase/isomerase family protein [Novosphingobium sp.]
MTAQKDGTFIRVDLDGPIGRIVFDRPELKNAVNTEMHSAFLAALQRARMMTDMRVLLIQAEGSAFSAGGDFAYMRQLRADPGLRLQSQREAFDICTTLNEMPMPVIAVMHGHAIGFGATVVTSCDMVVAWKDAKLSDPHVCVGLTAGDGGVLSWTAAVGVMRAKRMLLTGDAMTAAEAHAIGLVTDLVDSPEDALPAAEKLAERIAALPPLAVKGTKQIFNALERNRNAGVMHTSILTEMQALMSEDFEEALAAMSERRPGQFKGR